jgi:hypothetical protein
MAAFDGRILRGYFSWTSRRMDGVAVPEQPVVKVRRCTEAGDAPGWQGATSENTGSI